jgi:anti-sigma regulatory factor (Ser/Thr protein kinase)
MSSRTTVHQNTDGVVVQIFRSHPSVLYHIRQFIRERAADISLDEESRNDLLVAVSEASANSMLHTSTPRIRVTWKLRDDCVEVQIADDGVFRRRAPMLDGARGHGIPLMMALVDEMTIREGTPRRPGTVVVLVKCPER